MTENNTYPKKRTYRDKDNNIMRGIPTKDILGDQIEVLAKRDYTWGKFHGLAIKARIAEDELVVIECLSTVVKKQLVSKQCPQTPFGGKIVERTSKDNNVYHSFLFDTTQKKGKT